jgi:hypothetical protein
MVNVAAGLWRSGGLRGVGASQQGGGGGGAREVLLGPGRADAWATGGAVINGA